MLKIAITVENGRFAPSHQGGNLSTVLQSLGRAVPKVSGEEALKGPVSFQTAQGLATVTATTEPTMVETRRDRLKRRIIWTGLPGVRGSSCIHARLDVRMHDRGFITRCMWVPDTELNTPTFWNAVATVETRLLDVVERIADDLS